MEPIVSVNKLTCSYEQREVLHGITLSLSRGDVCVILGPNGSGKSTLLNCMSGLITYQSGDVTVAGQPTHNLSLRQRARHMAILVQDVQKSFPYTVTEMVVMGRTPHLTVFERPSAEEYEIARSTIQMLDIEHLADRPFTDLSGGERQMVRLARALAQEAEVLLLDEPTAHLDIKNTWLMLTKIKELAIEKKLTILAAMHDPNLIPGIATRVIMLNEGYLFRDGAPSEIMTAENLSELYRIPLKTVPIAPERSLVYHPIN